MKMYRERVKPRSWLLVVLPGILIAGFFAGIGRLAVAAGVLCGVLLWAFGVWLLVVCTMEVTATPGGRRRLVFVLLHVAKYGLLGAAIYGAVKCPQIDVVGLAGGYTIGLAGFIAANLTASERDSHLSGPGL